MYNSGGAYQGSAFYCYFEFIGTLGVFIILPSLVTNIASVSGKASMKALPLSRP